MMRHWLLALGLLSGCAPRAGAATSWIRSTPGAGGAFTQASASGDTVWVAADIAGFYRTLDGGKSWTAMGLATPVSGAAVAVKPAAPPSVTLVMVRRPARPLPCPRIAR